MVPQPFIRLETLPVIGYVDPITFDRGIFTKKNFLPRFGLGSPCGAAAVIVPPTPVMRQLVKIVVKRINR
jgi:hypothetical protein